MQRGGVGEGVNGVGRGIETAGAGAGVEVGNEAREAHIIVKNNVVKLVAFGLASVFDDVRGGRGHRHHQQSRSI